MTFFILWQKKEYKIDYLFNNYACKLNTMMNSQNIYQNIQDDGDIIAIQIDKKKAKKAKKKAKKEKHFKLCLTTTHPFVAGTWAMMDDEPIDFTEPIINL